MVERMNRFYGTNSYCNYCGEWMPKGVRCLDCGHRLRNGPRALKYKSGVKRI